MSSFVETPPGLPELAQNLGEIVTQMRKLHSSALTVIAELDQADVARVAGYSSLSALVSDLMRITPRRASRLIAQAGLVAEVLTPTGHVTPAPLPLVRDALRDGALDPDHVDAIADVVKKIPAWAPSDTAEIVEKHLVETARAAHSSVVRSHGETLLSRIDPDGDAEAMQPAWTRTAGCSSPERSNPKSPKNSTRCWVRSPSQTAQWMTGTRPNDLNATMDYTHCWTASAPPPSKAVHCSRRPQPDGSPVTAASCRS